MYYTANASFRRGESNAPIAEASSKYKLLSLSFFLFFALGFSTMLDLCCSLSQTADFDFDFHFDFDFDFDFD